MLLFFKFSYLKKISDINNTEFVAVLIRFLGASVLPFCDFFVFAGSIRLVHCYACSTQVKPRGSEVLRYLMSGEKLAVLCFTDTHAC